MARFLAGAAACFLLLTGAFLVLAGPGGAGPGCCRTRRRRGWPRRRSLRRTSLPEPPEATPKSREEKRFSRADKDENGRIERGGAARAAAQGVRQARHQRQRHAVFEEWAVKTIDKFAGRRQGPLGLADAGRIRDHRAAAAEEETLCVLIMSSTRRYRLRRTIASGGGMKLTSVTYTSLARLDLQAADLEAIHRTAREQNALRRNHRSARCSTARISCRSSRGAEDAIEDLVERLRKDPRHNGLRDPRPAQGRTREAFRTGRWNWCG